MFLFSKGEDVPRKEEEEKAKHEPVCKAFLPLQNLNLVLSTSSEQLQYKAFHQGREVAALAACTSAYLVNLMLSIFILINIIIIYYLGLLQLHSLFVQFSVIGCESVLCGSQDQSQRLEMAF